MGFSCKARCSSCGYDVTLMLGAGKSNHTTFAAWPVSCKACKAVTTANYKQKPLACEMCHDADVLQIHDRALWAGNGTISLTWGDLTLSDGHYTCPKCDKLELQFTRVGLRFD